MPKVGHYAKPGGGSGVSTVSTVSFLDAVPVAFPLPYRLDIK